MKLCPLNQANGKDMHGVPNNLCQEIECAWWDGHNQCCAMLAITVLLTDRLVVGQ